MATETHDTDHAASAERPFEELLSELEDVVRRLEQGSLPLEAALAAFEQGVGLADAADQKLAAAEQRVEALLRRSDGTTERVPFGAAFPGTDLTPAE